MTADADRLLLRRLSGVTIAGTTLLDVQTVDVDDGLRDIRLYFASGTDPKAISVPEGLDRTHEQMISGALVLTCRPSNPGPFVLRIDGHQVETGTPEPDVMAGRNVGLATRNGEDAATVLDWLAYHKTHHGMDGAVILDRARPGSNADFIGKLEIALTASDLPRVVLVGSDVPLGKPDLPPEAHPFCVSEAPGHDRMEVPDPDPWSSPLGEALIFEILRARFLTEARAVANIDLHDLLFDHPEEETVFDAAVAAPNGVVSLTGRHCYPWRVRKNHRPSYGDHICVQFDKPRIRRRWCVAPRNLPADAVWKFTRIGNVDPDSDDIFQFVRCMAIRHPTDKISRIVPKSSLVEAAHLVDLSERILGFKPVRSPAIKKPKVNPDETHTAIVTTMKNEGPFILEWVAYHRAIGVSDFLIYTNDCTDGTDIFLDLLQKKGIVQHRENPFHGTGLKPQHAALQAAENEEVIKAADWVICMDVDEFLNIKTGDGTLDALYSALGDANMISCTWRLFGNADVHEFRDVPIISIMDRCAEEFTPKPHQAWGFKTLFRNIGIYKKLGVHRPKGLRPQLWDQVRWVNGSGKPMPRREFRNAWRSTSETFGYDLVSLNHYAVRSAESFLVKRDRGRVNHVEREQGLAYWFRMNNNAVEERSIQRNQPRLEAEMTRLLADRDIAAAHRACVKAHREKIDALKSTENYANFYRELISPRMEQLSRLHRHFGANVFLAGPESIPDSLLDQDHPPDFFFTVARQETQH